MNFYDRVFGAGPRGVVISLLLLQITCFLQSPAGMPAIMDNELLRYAVFTVCTLVSFIIIVWSLVSLPPGKRGRKLVIAGTFNYVRHPLYTAFVSGFVEQLDLRYLGNIDVSALAGHCTLRRAVNAGTIWR